MPQSKNSAIGFGDQLSDKIKYLIIASSLADTWMTYCVRSVLGGHHAAS